MQTRTGLISLSLLLLLSACAGKNLPPVTVLTPPAELMAECPEPNPRLVTNEDLTNGYLDMRGALRRCNADKAGLRAWAASVIAGNPK
ncbi:Rzl protein [Brevundimonas phage AA]|uniref:Rzl protein n=1 Tax=Brevundimonas phage AA TaxID=2880937 RepID=A0AAN0KL93_9CAUD|nr:Rzl protein [Brevundimonas phage BC]UCR90901.1 Rzl protein [Brevundimonas phage AA]